VVAPTGDAAVPDEPAGAVVRGVLRAEWARLRRFAELFPWTPLGLVIAAAAYAALERLARAQLDLVWLVVAYGGLALVALGPLVVIPTALLIALRARRVPPGHALLFETGVASETGFALPSPLYLPLVQLSWDWVEPVALRVEQRRKLGVLHERAALAERGRFERIERRVVISDVFGLSRIALRVRAEQALDVLPRLGGLRHLPALQALAAGDSLPHPMGLQEGDRLELRRYGSGDPARYIHWKVLARTRKLMVRTPERALSIARRTAAFLIAGEGDDPTAAAARLALERRLLGSDWVFGTDQQLGGVDRLDAALDALMRSRAGDLERSAEGLSAFVHSVEQKGPVSLVLFAPSRPGAWLERAAAVARRKRLHALIAIDGVHDVPHPGWLRRVLAFSSPPPGTLAADLERVVRVLSEAGASVSVLDRGSGQPLGAAHRKAMAKLELSSTEAAS
jgi:hypothetical protein